jgi:hypothetical protein
MAWEQRFGALIELDGDEWDAAHKRLEQEWLAAYTAAFVADCRSTKNRKWLRKALSQQQGGRGIRRRPGWIIRRERPRRHRRSIIQETRPTPAR